MAVVLGLNAYHGDASACVLVDGELVVAAEEERFVRVKHWAGYPRSAIRWCLEEADIAPSQVDYVAVNRDPRANVGRKLWYAARHSVAPPVLLDRVRNARAWLSVGDEFANLFPGETLHAEARQVEHHLAHLASAFLPTPMERAALVSVDGFGDFASTAWGTGVGSDVTIDGRVYFPHSLGLFYQAITQHLGFPNYGDEYKVMGLAPYGEPTYAEALRRVVKLNHDGSFALAPEYFRVADRSVSYEWRDGPPVVGRLYTRRLEDLLGPSRDPEAEVEARHRDLARSVQVVFEDAFFNLLNAVGRRYGIRALGVAGGCAANSVALGKVFERTEFTEVYVPPATGDAGGAIGAAAVVATSVGDPRCRMDSPFVGPRFGDDAIAALLQRRAADLNSGRFEIERIDGERTLCTRVAGEIADGQVVGWFQGRMEWGPRALGNRSILGDPRRPDMKAILNSKIKRRESFRPFAPSVLRERASDWFTVDDDVPYMGKVFPIREERRSSIPAVTHVDGTGRLQTVERTEHPLYHSLIASFEELTGVPMILNTSFNENEPIVCSPDEALECFLRTNMDVLVLGPFLVSRLVAG